MAGVTRGEETRDESHVTAGAEDVAGVTRGEETRDESHVTAGERGMNPTIRLGSAG